MTNSNPDLMQFPFHRIYRLPILAAFVIFGTMSCFTATAQVQIHGTSRSGGIDDIGTVFHLYDDGTGYETSSEFIHSTEGKYPRAIASVTDGVVRGITSEGGLNEAGTIFKYEDSDLTPLAHLDHTTHGSGARGELQKVDVSTWVTQSHTGAEHGAGALLRYHTDEGLSTLFAFDPPATGGNPTGALAFDAATETIYGTCSAGGSGSAGTVYAYQVDGEPEPLHHFVDPLEGTYPQGGVILASDGLLYGTTQSGGANGQGVIFSVDPETGEYTVLHHFDGTNNDGRYPFAGLIETESGALMGVCSEGGSYNTGTIFKYETDGSFTVVKHLYAAQDGGFSKSGLTDDGEGNLIGVTEFGGTHGFGTLFSITEDGVFTKIHDFDYTADGSNPVAQPVASDDGTLYGVCSDGGAAGFGSLFSFAGGSLVKIHDFSPPIGGALPRGLHRGSEAFYGITEKGGNSNNGVFFTTSMSGQTAAMHSFDGVMEGRSPNGDLTPTPEGDFIGTTRFGGLEESGTVFSMSTEGEYNLLYTFASANDGRFPYSAPVLHSDGNLYGTTVAGGGFDDGVIYRLDGDLNYTVLYEFFSFYDGAAPEAGLTEGVDGKLYGVTTTGGSFNAGTLYEFDPEMGVPMVLHQFNPDVEGGTPTAGLILHSDGALYGATSQGALGGGALYRYTPDAGFELIHALNPDTEGSAVGAALAESIDGTLYGFATQGGEYGQGTAFTYEETEGFTAIHHFQSPDATAPAGTPVLTYPECIHDADCTASGPCMVARCVFGTCEEWAIDPQFEALEIGPCETGLDQYDLTLSVNLTASPGGDLIIGGYTFALDPEQTEYVWDLTDLPSTGEMIDLSYEFTATGCNGTTGTLGTAPAPCPPILINFVLDAGGIEPTEGTFYIGGDFQGWNPSEHPMEETEPGIWEATLGMNVGEYEFNFFSGPSIFEAEYVIGDCDVNGKRTLEVDETGDTLYYCWGLCAEECPTDGTVDPSVVRFSLSPNLVGPGDSMRIEWARNPPKTATYRVVDASGKTVDLGTLPPSGSARIAVGAWSVGVYALIVETPDHRTVAAARFAVKR